MNPRTGRADGATPPRRWWRAALPLLVAAIFVAALGVLHHELRAAHLRDVARAIHQLPGPVLLAAVGLAIAAYGALVGYDLLGLRFVRARLPLRRVAFASFVGFSFSHNLGFGGLT